MLMLFREIITVYRENHTKPVNTKCGKNVEFLNAKSDSAYSNHWNLRIQVWNHCAAIELYVIYLKRQRFSWFLKGTITNTIIISYYKRIGPTRRYFNDH